MLNFLFDPLLAFEPIIAIPIFAIIVLIPINLCYRFLVNQEESKNIKERSKELNKQMKEEQKQGNTAKVNELMKEVMTENNKLMKMTMKPMIASFIVIILFFPWLHASYGDQTTVLQSNLGNVTLNNELYTIQLDGDIVKVMKEGSEVTSFTNSAKENIADGYYLIAHEPAGGFIFGHPEQVKFSKIIAQTPAPVPIYPSFNSIIVFNKTEFGWLGWYLMISIPFVIIIRKVLKIK